jgi:hypothetical protein
MSCSFREFVDGLFYLPSHCCSPASCRRMRRAGCRIWARALCRLCATTPRSCSATAGRSNFRASKPGRTRLRHCASWRWGGLRLSPRRPNRGLRDPDRVHGDAARERPRPRGAGLDRGEQPRVRRAAAGPAGRRVRRGWGGGPILILPSWGRNLGSAALCWSRAKRCPCLRGGYDLREFRAPLYARLCRDDPAPAAGGLPHREPRSVRLDRLSAARARLFGAADRPGD